MNNDVELIPVKGVLPSVQVQSDNVIYVPQAHKNKAGIVKEGDGVLIENGVVSLNKQTVEDMIDANKWVSYGFQQNLTEDEKGMARHNIGAGDNDFTGSWYDLANRPQETVDFAESERQKSKNLLLVRDSSYTNYGYTVTCTNGEFTLNGSSSDEATFSLTGTDGVKSIGRYAQSITITTGNSVKFKAGTYTFSSNSDTSQLGILYGDLGSSTSTGATLLGFNTTRTLTFNNDTYVVVYRYIGPNTYTNYPIGHFQAEEGSAATNYQPYNGQITHNGDAPVVFAESERQKSKNLLYIENTQNTTTITSYSDYVVLNGTPSLTTEYPYKSSTLPTGVKFEQGKKYTFSRQLMSGTGNNNFSIGLTLQDANGNGVLEVLIPNGQDSISFTINSNNISKYSCFINFDGTTTFTNAYYGLQIEEGSVATEYQPYNGAIVHEKEVSDVEHIETIYDKDTKNTIGGTAYTNGLPFYYVNDINLDVSGYSKLKCLCNWNEHASNWFSKFTELVVDLTTKNSDGKFATFCSMLPSNAIEQDGLDYNLIGFIIVNPEKTLLSIGGVKHQYNGTRTKLTASDYLNYFNIVKIEGVR